MPNDDLHGNVPDKAPAALVLIDVINDLEFEGGELLLPHARAAAERIRTLKDRARREGIPVVYANDNFGRWRSNFRDVVDHTLNENARGSELARMLHPDADDYFVLKPKHSAFFASTFEKLLEYLGARRLILTGYSGDVCVLLTAADAYMRDYELWVPADCVAAADPAAMADALSYMERVMDVDTTPSDELELRDLLSS